MKKFPKGRKNLVTKAVFSIVALSMTAPVFAETHYAYAQVVESTPVYRIVEVSTPRQECWNEEVAHTHNNASNSRTPALLGTIIGGALGNAVGHGKSNKRVGAVVGAVLGHSIGRDIVANNKRDRTVHYETVRQCETVYDYHEEERIIGYQVQYLYNDEEYSVRMDNDPGDRVRVKVNIQPVF